MVGVYAGKTTRTNNNINKTTSLGMWVGISNWKNRAVEKAAILEEELQMYCR
jgi:hypothetical protein